MTRKNFLFLFSLVALFFANALLINAQTGWTNAPKPATQGDINTVFFADSERGWIGGDDGYLAMTKDSGRSWTKLSLNTGDSINDIYFRGSDKGYVLAGDRIFSSTDGGATWREDRIFRAGEFGKATPDLWSIRFSDKKRGFVVGSVSQGDNVVDSLLIQTTDGGTTWRRVYVPTKNELLHVDFANEDRGWIVGDNGTILTTDDGGLTWRLRETKTTAKLFHVDFKNSNSGWAVGRRGLILRTEDGGATWQTVNSNVQRDLLSVEFVNEKNGWIVGRGGTILRSEDGGKTWIKQDSKTTDNLYALFIGKKYGWAVGGKGLILRYER